MSWTGECRQHKHAEHAPSTRMECDYSYDWIKNGHVMYAKISPKMVKPRDIDGNAEEEEEAMEFAQSRPVYLFK